MLLLASLGACARRGDNAAPDAAPPVVSPVTPPVTSLAPEGAALPSPSAAPSPEVVDAAPPRPPRKKHTRVLHTGDSMVGGGLTRALGPKFEAGGAKYKRDVIESGTIHDFAQQDHLPKLIAAFKPDLILLTLGTNHVPHSVDPEKEVGPYVPKLLARLKGIDCIWIAPPIWKPSQAKFNEWLSTHVAPCKFYDGSALEIERRSDKIHPTDPGGEVWADGFWKFFEGDGAFFELDAGAR